MSARSVVPRPVRVAGALTGVQGAVGALVTAALAVRAFAGPGSVALALGAAGWFAVCSGAVLWIGTGLWRGGQWARSPAVVAQLLLLGVCWYAAGPSARPEYGVPGAVYCVVVLALLFSPATRRWVYEDIGEPAER